MAFQRICRAAPMTCSSVNLARPRECFFFSLIFFVMISAPFSLPFLILPKLTVSTYFRFFFAVVLASRPGDFVGDT